MGAIFSSSKKSEPTTLEKLEKIETKIKDIEFNIQQDRRREKKIWASVMFTAGFLYVSVAGFLHVFILKRQSFLDYTKLVALWVMPLVIIYFVVQRFIPWYFSRGIQEYRENLRKLREEKKKILDRVRETEPYNKAKTILEKYEGPQKEPATQKPVPNPVARHSLPCGKMPITPFPGSGPRPTTYQPQPRGPITNRPPPPPYPVSSQFPIGRPPQMKERGAFDRVLDYIVKDGPENRMALICRACGAHNGLCLLDEYDFTGFRCFECRLPNPPRRPRPSMTGPTSPYGNHNPPLNRTASPPSLEQMSGSGSESDSESGTEGKRTPPVFQATVKKPLSVISDDSPPSIPTVSMVADHLAESDTGSESGDEMDPSSRAQSAESSGIASNGK